MTSPLNRNSRRKFIYDALSLWCEGDIANDDKVDVINAIKDKFTQDDTAYGLASARDFGELAVVFSNLFAHSNKQYYIYKAISDSNKIGYLSKRQHFMLTKKMEYCVKNHFNSREREAVFLQFLEKNGTMASPYKLLKRSFKDNPRARFLTRFFPLQTDKKTTTNEDVLIELCDLLMRSKTNIEILPADINECYKVKLTDDYSGSGERFTTSSCMYGYPVGKFYEAFGAEGRIVYERGKPIGRFLLWNLPDGRQYIDRLYVQGHGHEDALAEIDKQFPTAWKYPQLLSQNAGRFNPYFIELKNKDVLLDKNNIPRTPYLDTFCYLLRKDGKYYLSNVDHSNINHSLVQVVRDVYTNKHFCSCPHCKQLYWMGDEAMDAGNKSHLLVCTAYQPRSRKLQEMVAIYREYLQGDARPYDSRTTLFQV